MIGVTSPTESELVKNVLEAGKRKEPISAELLLKMYDKFFFSMKMFIIKDLYVLVSLHMRFFF